MSSGAHGALEAAPAEALPEVPREGLSLAALRAFADAHAGTTYELSPGAESLPFEQLTTAQVCAAVVKPATLVDGAGCTYAELLLAQARAHGMILLLRLTPGCGSVAVRALTFSTQGVCDVRGQPHVARATRFVSHAWAYPFADLLAALQAHAEQDTQTEYFWIGTYAARGCQACFCPVS